MRSRCLLGTCFLLLLARGAVWAAAPPPPQSPEARQQRQELTDIPYRPAAPTRELRLGLVCYGGVSLAIYMHGITRELHNLVLASRALEADVPADELPPGSIRAYHAALADLERRDGVQTRVLIDSIAGTSAGGINGVFLAKALAHDLPQDSLRDLWLEKGDINRLLGGRFQGFLRLVRLAVGLPFGKARPPLSGDSMFRWIHEALSEMNRHEQRLSLVPRGHELRLFVTATDFYGLARHVPVGDPAAAIEKQHRGVLSFRYARRPDGTPSADDFGPEDDPVLAFAARATSSFPGAFPPINLRNIQKNVAGVSDERLREIAEQFFRLYELEDADVAETYFVDGGVLDNYPFGLTIADIVSRPSAREAKRLLLYLQPDPGQPPGAAPGREPGFVGTIWGGLSTISGYEPIADDLGRVQSFNARVARLKDIITRSTPAVSDVLADRAGLDPGEALPPLEEIAGKRQLLDELVRETSPLLYEGYFQIRVHSVVDQLGSVLARRCAFPPESNHALFVAAAVRDWAGRHRLIGAAADRAAQERFVAALDLGYSRRQLRFVEDAVDSLYAEITPGAHPDRADLDAAKARLQEVVEELSAVIQGRDLPAALQQELAGLCGTVDPWAGGAALSAAAAAWAGEHAGALDRLEEALVSFVGSRREAIRAKLYAVFRDLTGGWAPAARERVLVQYLGFPFWDALVYPLRSLGDVGEIQEINVYRISPDDAVALGGGIAAEKLEGVALGHFAAFFARDKRENDYLWGRLDGAERLLALLGPEGRRHLGAAFSGVLDEEAPALPTTAGLVRELRRKIDSLAAAAAQTDAALEPKGGSR